MGEYWADLDTRGPVYFTLKGTQTRRLVPHTPAHKKKCAGYILGSPLSLFQLKLAFPARHTPGFACPLGKVGLPQENFHPDPAVSVSTARVRQLTAVKSDPRSSWDPDSAIGRFGDLQGFAL